MLLASLCITLFSYAYLQQCDEQREEYYILLSLAVLGAAVLIASDHFASFFIGIELLSVSIFALVGYLVKDRSSRPHSLEASIKYMILSGVSSSFLLFGIALIYADTGVLQFAQLQTVISSHTFGGYSEIGFAMLVIGLGFKVSWVPFHMWTPDVYEGAPVPVSTFLATVSKLAVFASITRIYIGSGGDGFSALNPILIFIAMSSMLVGNGLALRQSNLKRLLAYSSIAHMGYLLVALLAAGNIVQQGDKQMALEAVGFYLVAYVIMSLVAFGVINLLSRPHDRMEAEYLDQYQGLFWRRPWLATSLSLSLLSLAASLLPLVSLVNFI
jgi:NADH-quinone oxidoreductase subunit N